MVQTPLTRNTVGAHASLVERVTTGNPAWNRFMLFLTVLVMPLLLLIRPPRPGTIVEDPQAVID